MQALLNMAIEHFQRGEYAAAARLCQQNVSVNPMFELILASSLGKQGQFSASHKHFKSLRTRYPANLDVIYNQALTYFAERQYEKAKAGFKDCVKANKQYHPAWHSLGNLHAEMGELSEAESAFQQAIALSPGHPIYTSSLANLRIQQQQYNDALTLLTPLLKDRLTLEVAESALIALYHLSLRDKASMVFASASRIGLSSTNLYFYAGLVEVEEKRYFQAKRYLSLAGKGEVAQRLRNSLRLNLAFCDYMLSNDMNLITSLIDSLEDASSEDYLFLARLFESAGEFTRCNEMLDRVNTKYQERREDVSLIRARAALAQRNDSEAEELLQTLRNSDNISEEVRYLSIRLADRKKAYADAASLMAEAQSRTDSEAFVHKFTEDVNKVLPEFDKLPEPAATCDGMPNMVFIVGFPRSGTTLLETRLASLPGCKVLEETLLVKHFYQRIEAECKGRQPAEWLQQQSQDVISHWQQEFMGMVTCYTGPLSPTDWLLDKMPFNCLYLPLIRVIFPQAKIIWAHRHPKDIYISCLQQAELKIDSADQFIRAYSAYLSLWQKVDTTKAGWLMPVYYETMVSDMAVTLEQVIAWAGLPNQVGSGNDRMVITPSYHAVKEEVNQRAVNRFKHYASFDSLWTASFDPLTSALGYQ